MAIIKQKIGVNSKKVTSGDPKEYSNHQSHMQINKQNEPQRPR